MKKIIQIHIVDRIRLDGVSSCRFIFVEDNINLIVHCFLIEFDRAVALCNGNKRLDPVGFNLFFFKRLWSLLKDDFGEMLAKFQQFATPPRSFTSFFPTLIPKIDSLSQLGDFRPISLVESLYKIIFKILVARLTSVMDKLISHNKYAFLKCIILVDGVVDVNELVDLVKRRKKFHLLFKVDFEKVYDSVNWSFLDLMPCIFGFNDKWRTWIRA